MVGISPARGAERYTRKAVAAIRSVALTQEGIRITGQQQELLNEALENHLILARFDQLVLPASLQQQFSQRVQGRVVSDADLQSDLDAIVVPTMEWVLQTTLEDRAGKDRVVWDRRSFLKDKAHSRGFTVEELENMMDCAFLYVPYLTKCEIKGSGDKTSVNLAGGLHWYFLDLSGEGGPHMVKACQVASSATGGPGSWSVWAAQNVDVVREWTSFLWKSKPKSSSQGGEDDDDLPPELSAFRNAANHLALNLSTKTRNAKGCEGLRMMFRISDVEGSTILCHGGCKEGLTIDDRYEVFDIYEDETGLEHREKKGHCMVRKVADNREDGDALSRARMIIGGGDVALGMEVSEVARMGIDLSVRPLWSPFKIDSLPSGSLLSVNEPTEDGAYGLDLTLDMNVGRRIGVSQFFISVGGGYGYVPVDIKLLSEDVKRGAIVGLHGGLSKRFYLGRPAVRFDVDYGLYTFSVDKKIDETKWQLKNQYQAVRGGGGLELALSTNLNFGVYGGYQWTSDRGGWKLKVDDSESPEWATDFEGVDSDGPYAGVVFTYALASLGWNPF
jgi:hypothetical protein